MFHVKHEWAVLESIYSLIEHRGGAGGCLAAGWCHAVDAGGWMPVKFVDGRASCRERV